jgi:subtilisin family serine protease
MADDKTLSAYWSDVLHGKSTKTSWSAKSKESPSFEPASILAAAKIDPNDADALQFTASLLESISVVPSDKLTRRFGAKVLPMPGRWRGPIAEQFMWWFVRDAAQYFFDEQKRRQIKQRLIDKIPISGEPFVLVTHSLGTVIGYEVLSELSLSQRAEAGLFVTLGSPLGLQEMQDEIRKRVQTLTIPDGVRAWHNFADGFDPIALDVALRDDFDSRNGVEIQDHLIGNTEFGLFKGWNPHNPGGYLAHPKVRNVVYRAAQHDPTARFLVARDVAERFASEERQPVLIEVLEPGYWAMDEEAEDLQARESELPIELQNLEGRGTHLATELNKIVFKTSPDAIDDAAIVKLRKYVAARLTPTEIQSLTSAHDKLNVFRVWRSSPKKALTERSRAPLGVDAAAVSYGATGRGVTWAVLDTGCRWDHPHFKNCNIEQVWDCTRRGDLPLPITKENDGDRDGHGTHVSGIIAGSGSVGRHHYAGMAPEASLVVYKVLDDFGQGEDAWIIKAIDHVWRTNANTFGLKIHGVNLSLGGAYDPWTFGCGFSPICTELRGLWRQGVVVCVAAGNEGQIEVKTDAGSFQLNTSLSIGDPANLEECIAIGSVHADKPNLYGVSHFSSRGPTSDGRQKPDVVAPGEKIWSCNAHFKAPTRGRKRTNENQQLYVADSGTSMACPHISGLIAAFLSVRQEFKGEPDKVKQILLANCNDLHRNPYHQGAGIPNLVKMLVNT